MSKLVYLPVEVQKRELLGKIFLANVLLNNGYQVIIGSYDKVKNYALSKKNGIYLDKAFFKGFCSEAKTLKKHGFLYCAWDEEGLITGKEQQYIDQRVSKDTLDALDLIFCWGKEQFNAITNFAPECKEKTVIVGNPRLDLLRKECKKFYLSSNNETKDDYVLINTNFLYTKVGMDEREKRTLAFQVEDLGEAFKYVESQIEITKKIKKVFLDTIAELANVYDGKILIRPHPAEDEEEYIERFKSFGNIEVSKKGDIAFALAHAKCAIHNSCTTGLEAFLAGVPTIAYLPNGLYTYDDSISNKIGVQVTSKEQLIDMVLKLDNMKADELQEIFFDSANNRILSDYVDFDEDKESSEKIVELLDSASKGLFLDSKVRVKFRYFIYDLYYHYFGNDNVFEHKYYHLTRGYVKKTINHLRESMGQKRGVKVIPVASDVYWLRK